MCRGNPWKAPAKASWAVIERWPFATHRNEPASDSNCLFFLFCVPKVSKGTRHPLVTRHRAVGRVRGHSPCPCQGVPVYILPSVISTLETGRQIELTLDSSARPPACCCFIYIYIYNVYVCMHACMYVYTYVSWAEPYKYVPGYWSAKQNIKKASAAQLVA